VLLFFPLRQKKNRKIEVIFYKIPCFYFFFFFASPKKKQKRSPANNYIQFAGTAMWVICATVASASVILLLGA